MMQKLFRNSLIANTILLIFMLLSFVLAFASIEFLRLSLLIVFNPVFSPPVFFALFLIFDFMRLRRKHKDSEFFEINRNALVLNLIIMFFVTSFLMLTSIGLAFFLGPLVYVALFFWFWIQLYFIRAFLLNRATSKRPD